MIDQVREFMEVVNHPVATRPSVPAAKELWATLVKEEYTEFTVAHEADDLVALSDALADLAYVVYGTAVAYGLPLDALLTEVHRSNMTKGGPNAPIREDGKVLKGITFSPPNILRVLRDECGWIGPHPYQYGGFEVMGDCGFCGHVKESEVHV